LSFEKSRPRASADEGDSLKKIEREEKHAAQNEIDPLTHCLMALFTVREGGRYRARIRLGVVEAIASNAKIAEELRKLGFADITVSDSGRDRHPEGMWPVSDTTAEIPDRIVTIQELDSAVI